MSELLVAELNRAMRALDLARARVRQQRAAYGGVDRDVARRLDAALARVRWLESATVA
jgi:hypothetical protein